MPTPNEKHTPGPWNPVTNPDGMSSFQVLGYFRASIETSDGNKTVAYLPELGHEETNPQLRANAHLIAAAPDLRDVVGDLYRLLREWSRTPFFDDPTDWHRWLNDFGARVDSATDHAMQVINKAEGRQS